jgi:hypothetical protein
LFADNGGPTQTFALLAGSSAINAGSNATCNAVLSVNNLDQRGSTRTGNGPNCDIGAYEYQDDIAPTVSMSSTAVNPISTLPVAVTVTFSESVTDFTESDIVPSNGTVSDFSGSGAIYTFNLTPTANGVVAADILADVAYDVALNPNTDAAQFSRIYDTTSPTISSILRATPTLSNLSSVEFTVTFSESVTNVDTSDFKLTNTYLTGASIVSVTGSGSTYTVTVNTGTGNGSIRLDVRNTATIEDLAGNAFTGPYMGGQTYNVWKGEAPTVPLISAPLNAALVTNTPTLSWGESNAIMALSVPGWHYEVNVTAPNGFNQNYTTEDDADVEIGLGRTSLTITEPLPDLTTFTWKVRAYNDTNAYSAWSLSRTFKTVLVPELNSPVNNETLPNKRPTFEWDEVPGATGYTVQVMKGTAVAHTGTVKAPAYTYTPTVDLLPNTTYTWRVMAAVPIGGVYSQPLTFTTSPNPPALPTQSAPANAAVLADNPAQVLDWNPVAATTTAAAAQSYEVQYANNKLFIGATFNSVFVDAPDTQLTIATLPGRTYYWRVRAYSGAGGTGNYGAWSLVRTFNVKFVAPLLLTPTNAATGAGIRPTFTWSANGNGIWTNYTLQVASDAAFTQGLRNFTVKAPKTSYTIPANVAGLTAGTKYWRVKINGLYVPITSATQIFTP